MKDKRQGVLSKNIFLYAPAASKKHNTLILNKEKHKTNAACGISGAILFAAVVFWMGCSDTPVNDTSAAEHEEKRNDIVLATDTVVSKTVMVKTDLLMMCIPADGVNRDRDNWQRVILAKRYYQEMHEVTQQQRKLVIE